MWFQTKHFKVSVHSMKVHSVKVHSMKVCFCHSLIVTTCKIDPKSEKFHKAKKFVKFWCFWGSFLNFFDFERLGHFWLIFRSQFLIFRLLGAKESKTKNFQKCIFLVSNREIFHISWNFSVSEFLTPKSQKNENWLWKISQKWPKSSKSKKFMKKSKKHHNHTIFLA